ncbi:MAG TPA: glycosyltransferase family A protein [Gemmatimonadaceae bacterium]|nr:glycosyltransferase family A protein [Gemmatimonadaceae bacterium]
MGLVAPSVTDAGGAPVVSVLVTVFNRESFLPACLDSILASTFDDFEVVVVDDLSTDDSYEVALRYAARDKRISVHRNDRNLGDYPNRMRAAAIARGTYLKYVDSDDVIYPTSLAIMVAAMDANWRAALGMSHSLPEDEKPYPWFLEPAESWRKEFLGDGCLGSGPTGAILRRAAFLDAGGFHDWGVLSDTELWYRMSARWPVVLLPPGLVWWRRHEQQEFSRDDAATTYLEKGFALTMHALSLHECPLTETERQRARERARQHHARRLLSLALLRRRPALALRLMRRGGLTGAEMLQGFRSYR